jgi:hypothetical protein
VVTAACRARIETARRSIWARICCSGPTGASMTVKTIMGARVSYTDSQVRTAEDRGFEPRRVVTPNRISSSGRHGSDPFMLDQHARPVLSARRRTALNCNPQIRSSGQAVQVRPGVSALWADVPGLATCDRCRPAAWQQCWQQSSASRPLISSGQPWVTRLLSRARRARR